MIIPGDIKEMVPDDVINCDVIENLKMVQILKFLLFSIENDPTKKKHYYKNFSPCASRVFLLWCCFA